MTISGSFPPSDAEHIRQPAKPTMRAITTKKVPPEEGREAQTAKIPLNELLKSLAIGQKIAIAELCTGEKDRDLLITGIPRDMDANEALLPAVATEAQERQVDEMQFAIILRRVKPRKVPKRQEVPKQEEGPQESQVGDIEDNSSTLRVFEIRARDFEQPLRLIEAMAKASSTKSPTGTTVPNSLKALAQELTALPDTIYFFRVPKGYLESRREPTTYLRRLVALITRPESTEAKKILVRLTQNVLTRSILPYRIERILKQCDLITVGFSTTTKTPGLIGQKEDEVIIEAIPDK